MTALHHFRVLCRTRLTRPHNKMFLWALWTNLAFSLRRGNSTEGKCEVTFAMAPSGQFITPRPQVEGRVLIWIHSWSDPCHMRFSQLNLLPPCFSFSFCSIVKETFPLLTFSLSFRVGHSPASVFFPEKSLLATEAFWSALWKRGVFCGFFCHLSWCALVAHMLCWFGEPPWNALSAWFYYNGCIILCVYVLTSGIKGWGLRSKRNTHLPVFCCLANSSHQWSPTKDAVCK